MLSCSTSSYGSDSAPAETRIRSKGPASGRPSTPAVASMISTLLRSTISGSIWLSDAIALSMSRRWRLLRSPDRGLRRVRRGERSSIPSRTQDRGPSHLVVGPRASACRRPCSAGSSSAHRRSATAHCWRRSLVPLQARTLARHLGKVLVIEGCGRSGAMTSSWLIRHKRPRTCSFSYHRFALPRCQPKAAWFRTNSPWAKCPERGRPLTGAIDSDCLLTSRAVVFNPTTSPPLLHS